MGTYLLDPPAYAPPLSRRRIWTIVCSCLAVAVVAIVVSLVQQPLAFDGTAVAASNALRDGMKSIKNLRIRLSLPVDPALDPAGSGLIGIDYSDITTTLGSLRAKQTSLNPQFAGLMVTWLQQLGLRAGDRAALSLTGSFPALNMAALYACSALDLEPVIISSVGASSYGANIPNLTWLDMERHLHTERLIPWRSQYASLGGIVETDGGLDGTGYMVGETAIQRHGAQYLREDGPRTLVRDIEKHLALYRDERPPRVFINVGGSITSLGWVPEAALLDNGLLAHVPHSTSPQRGIVFRMAEAGVPVIHLINIERLAADHHLPIAPAALDLKFDPVAGHRAHQLLFGVVLLGWFAFGVGFVLKSDPTRRRREQKFLTDRF